MAVIGQSFDTQNQAPIYGYEQAPGMPPVSITRFDRDAMEGLEPGHSHAHDFLVLAYFERGGGSLGVGNRRFPVDAGDVFVVAPGEVISVGGDVSALARTEGWAVYFPPEGLGPQAPDALLGWRTHPLLLPFARGATAGAQQLRVPSAKRKAWSRRFAAIDRELRERRDGFREAVVAHLTLVLVDTARLSADIVGDLKLKDEPLLADVFDFIERNYAEPISLKDVASALALSPGHLTTMVRRKTGRTVQYWISERRMTQARRLLVETDRTVAEVGRNVGFADPVYFARCFRRAHGTTALRWRRAGRP